MLFDFEVFDLEKDFSYQKTYYVHRSPPMISDRDFVLECNMF